MADAADLVQRLRDYYTSDSDRFRIDHPICDEAANQIERLHLIEARYHWLCAHLTQIHVETTQPAGSPADTPMRVTLMQVWPGLPRTDAASVDEAVAEAMKEGV